MTSSGVPPIEKSCEAGVPDEDEGPLLGWGRHSRSPRWMWRTTDRRCASTDREPGRVSADSISWLTWVPGERSEFWIREALANAWRWSVVWRSLRKL